MQVWLEGDNRPFGTLDISKELLNNVNGKKNNQTVNF
jgi:hypothetical protein